MPGIGSVGTSVPQGAPAQASTPAGLRPGAVVTVEVREPAGAGGGVLQIRGEPVRALFPEGLAPGARLPLQVLSSGPPPVLGFPPEAAGAEAAPAAAPPPPRPEAAVRALLQPTAAPEEAGVAGEAARWLEAARLLLDLPQDPGGLARALARWVPRSGVFHEARLEAFGPKGDLKGILLRLVGQLPPGALRDAAEGLLGHLETFQARSLVGEAVVVPVVLPWGERFVSGELRLPGRGGGRKGRRGSPRSLVLRLRMPRLGPVEVRVLWGAPGVSVRLALTPYARPAVESRLEELARSLGAQVPLPIRDLRVDPLPEEPAAGDGALVEVVA
ncbi:MAG: hypothetical protein Kow0092_14500 [Deferrisomatales bacterium]